MRAEEQGGSAVQHKRRYMSPLAGTRLWNARFLSDEDRDALAEAASPARTFRASTDLIREGERGDALSVVVEGWACRYMTTRDGARQLPALLLPGDVANLDSLMFDQPNYGVRTLGELTITALPIDRVRALAARSPGIAQAFTWLVTIENAILGKWAQSLGRRSAKARLAHLLCELGVRLNAEHDNESNFPLPMTQEHIADVLGLTAVHVNRMLQQLRDEGLAKTASRTITVPDVARLRQIGGFDPAYLHLQSSHAAAQVSN